MSVITCTITRKEAADNPDIQALLVSKGFKFYKNEPLGKITKIDDYCASLTHYKQVIKDGR